MKLRNIHAAALSALLICMSVSTLSASAAGKTGDVDGNGIIDGVDATYILTHYARASANKGDYLSAEYQKYADVDEDGKIDGIDATTVLSYYSKTSVGYEKDLDYYVANNRLLLDVYGSGLEGEDQAESMLEGNWLLAQGSSGSTANSEYGIQFSSSDSSFLITDNLSGSTASGKYILKNLYDTPRGCFNLITNEPPLAIKTKFLTGNLDQTLELQFTAVNLGGTQLMAVNTVGNGVSIMDTIVGTESQAADGIWLFKQQSNATYHVVDELEMADLREKGKTFYAYRWLDRGDEVYLQTMDTAVTTDKLDDGVERELLYYSYPNNGHALTAVRYDVANADKHTADNYCPALVRVTVDASGKVTEISEVKQLGYGYYEP